MKIAIFVLVGMLAGCGSSPTVTYIRIATTPPSDNAIADTYYLNRTVLSVTPVAADLQKQTPATYKLSAEPIEHTEFKVGLIPKNNLLSTTKVNIAKVENSDRVSSIGVETTNNIQT